MAYGADRRNSNCTVDSRAAWRSLSCYFAKRPGSGCRAGSGGRENGGGREANGCRADSDSRAAMSTLRSVGRPGKHEYTRKPAALRIRAAAGDQFNQLTPPPSEKGMRRYFSEELIEVNFSFRVVPRPLTTAMIASEMPAAISPYSMAVAPDSSFQNFKTERFMCDAFSRYGPCSTSSLERNPSPKISKLA